MKKTINFLLISLLLSCQVKNNDNHKQPVQGSDQNIKSIEVVPQGKMIKLSSFAEKIDYIVLDSSKKHPVGEISKVIFTNDQIFVMDKDHTFSIFCYDHKGHFLFKIAKKGHGPDEYVKLSDFTIDKQSNQIIIYDRSSQTFFFYDINGHFIKKEKNNLYIDAFDIQHETFACYTQTSSHKHLFSKKPSHLFFCDKNYKLVKGYLPFDEPNGYDGMYAASNIYNNFSGDSVKYFYHSGGNKVYKLENKKIKPFIYIDFKDKNVPEDYYYKNKYEAISKDVKEGTIIPGLSNFIISGNWFIALFPYKQKGYQVLYNIKTDEQICGNLINDIDHIPTMGVFFSWDNKLVSVLPSYVINMLKSNKEFISKVKLPQDIIHLKEHDNPVLQVITLKQ